MFESHHQLHENTPDGVFFIFGTFDPENVIAFQLFSFRRIGPGNVSFYHTTALPVLQPLSAYFQNTSKKLLTMIKRCDKVNMLIFTLPENGA